MLQRRSERGVVTALCDGTCPSDRQSCSPAPGPGRCLLLLSPGPRGPDSDSDRALGSDSPVAAPPELSLRAPAPLSYSGAIIWAGDWRLDDDPCAITLSKPLGAARCQKR